MEIPDILNYEIPELITFDKGIISGKGIYSTMDSMVAFLKHNLSNDSLVRRCFKLVACLHRNGNKAVRSAIENTFIHSLSFIDLLCCNERNRVRALMPDTLYLLYIDRVVYFGV